LPDRRRFVSAEKEGRGRRLGNHLNANGQLVEGLTNSSNDADKLCQHETLTDSQTN